MDDRRKRKRRKGEIDVEAIFVITLIVSYLIGVRVTARRYYLRRHGVPIESSTIGRGVAGYVGIIWPAALFFEPLKNPQLCMHFSHVEQRQALRAEIERHNQLLEHERRERQELSE
jgi:hypothetical protein